MMFSHFLKCGFILTFLFFLSCSIFAKTPPKELFFYVGTYTTDSESKGIYLFKMNSESGKIENIAVIEDVINPSFLAIDKTNNCLYSVNEISDYEGTNSGSISAFKINPLTKNLTFLNKKSSRGANPCYITFAEKNNFILTANYTGGSIALHSVDNTGALTDASDVVQHEGSSINPKRQNEPHAHSINLDNENKYAYAVDLGIDEIITYTIGTNNGKLIANNKTGIEPGAGPRHFTIHPNGKFAYIINELNNTVISFSVNSADGSLNKIETYSTLPEDFGGTSYCADIHIHPNGKFLYGSNRGHNSIVIYKINEENGRLTRTGFEPTQGNWPRNFTIDPTGNFLLAANQKSNNITVFLINKTTGLLDYTGISETVPSPVCLLFYNE